MRSRRSIMTLCAVVVIASLGACREAEQGRVLDLEPGVYKGKKEAALSMDVMRDLQRRALMQGDPFAMSGGGGAQPSPGADVRRPSAAGNRANFVDRMRGQKN